jgi:adenylate cyclase
MTAFLSFSTNAGRERVPCGSVTTIGRDRNNQIVFSDLRVSRNHAMVRQLGAADYYLIDSGSSNGSWLNDRRITTPTLLHDGDRILIGGTELVFEQASPTTDTASAESLQATVVMDHPLIGEITILVADIRGFTSISERLTIQQLTRVMNQWFHSVSDIIEHHRGVVDKFIGDCVFARWESGDARQNVRDALRTACLIGTSTAKLNDDFPELDHPLRIGVGINTGLAALTVGHENTALGDSVNTAFRLETASKEIEADIVLSESAYLQLPPEYRKGVQREIRLKGKANPVHVLGLAFNQAEHILSRWET